LVSTLWYLKCTSANFYRRQGSAHCYYPRTANALRLALHCFLLGSIASTTTTWNRASASSQPIPDHGRKESVCAQNLQAAKHPNRVHFFHHCIFGRPLQHHHPPIYTGRQPTLCLLRLPDPQALFGPEVPFSPGLLCLCMAVNKSTYCTAH
jgi:hypothetical protein